MMFTIGLLFGVVMGFVIGMYAQRTHMVRVLAPRAAARLEKEFHKLRSKEHKLWSSIDGGHHWEVIGESDDVDVLIHQRQDAIHSGADSFGDMVILHDGEEPIFQKHGSGVG